VLPTLLKPSPAPTILSCASYRFSRRENEPQTDCRWSMARQHFFNRFQFLGRCLVLRTRPAARPQSACGLMDSSVGGTPAEAWTPREALEKNPDLKKFWSGMPKRFASTTQPKPKKNTIRATKKHAEAVKNPKAEANQPYALPTRPTDPARASKRPSCLYNAMNCTPGTVRSPEPFGTGRSQLRSAVNTKTYSRPDQRLAQSWARANFPFLFVKSPQ